jgi:hypothetical protein
LFLCFTYAVAFLADAVVAVAVPERVNYGVLVLPIPCRTENFGWVLVAVVAVAVAAERFLFVGVHANFPSPPVFPAAKTKHA